MAESLIDPEDGAEPYVALVRGGTRGNNGTFEDEIRRWAPVEDFVIAFNL